VRGSVGVNTSFVTLSPGNIVRIIGTYSAVSSRPNVATVPIFRNGIFQTNDELIACNSIQDEGDKYPYIIAFQKQICQSEYDLINANRRNYIDINGYKGYVKRLNFKPNGLSEFELLTSEIPCCNA
jgi:hypothetical protein